MSDKLKAAVLAFEDFLNEPPDYEDRRMVREYRHAAYARWSELRDQVTAALLPAQEWQDISTAVTAEREACAKLAGDTALAWDNTLGGRMIGEEVSKAILARGTLIADYCEQTKETEK